MWPRLGALGTAARALTFRTRQAHDPLGFVRTFGAVVERGSGPLDFSEDEAIGHAPASWPSNCARGKVAAFSRDEATCDAACYQLSDGRGDARLVGCCNATAAAAALFAAPDLAPRVAMRVAVPGAAPIGVEARLVHHPAVAAGSESQTSVLQTWTEVPFSVQRDHAVDGRRYAVISGPLNDYLVLLAKDAGEVEAASGAWAVDLWRRLELTSEPLRARVAIVAPGPRGPHAKFFTCGGREHPTAPMTGLAVLALAAPLLSWLPLATGSLLWTRSGPMPTPQVTTSARGLARISFPELLVAFEGNVGAFGRRIE